MKKLWVVLVYPFIGWILCAVTMKMAMHMTSEDNALIIHAIAATIYFFVISILYFRRAEPLEPIPTAVTFTLVVALLDVLIVASLIERSYEMFNNALGTWIPFVMIFVATLFTGVLFRPLPDDLR